MEMPTALITASSFAWEQITKCVNVIGSYPMLLIPVGIFVAGAGIGLAKRLIGQ